jgi:acetyl-CoA acetyltransferase
MFTQAFVPYKGYWSSPFCKWQGSFQNKDSVELGAASAKKFMASRGYDLGILDGIVYGSTIPQRWWFYDSPNVATLMGNPNITGPRIAQACATSTVSVNYAAGCIQNNSHQNLLVVASDRMSNGPNLLWPNPAGPGGKPEFESWIMDGFGWDPTAETSPTGTAENVAKKYGFTRQDSDAMAINRYNKYTKALENDRAFQKGYMLPVEIRVSKKKTIMVEADEGITPCTEEGMARLKTKPDCVVTFGAQTHPADGNAGIIVTTAQRAKELSADGNITIQILAYGYSRADKGHMPEAPVPAAKMALANAGIQVTDLAAVKTHNPFAINDLAMEKLMGIEDRIFNNYGSSMIFGHPQGPTTMRLLVELIEELVLLGGGYGLVAGCAAGDSGAALVVKVNG